MVQVSRHLGKGLQMDMLPSEHTGGFLTLLNLVRPLACNLARLIWLTKRPARVAEKWRPGMLLVDNRANGPSSRTDCYRSDLVFGRLDDAIAKWACDLVEADSRVVERGEQRARPDTVGDSRCHDHFAVPAPHANAPV
jgi:hypothetical protein